MQVLALLNDSSSSNHNRIESLLNPTTTNTSATNSLPKKYHADTSMKESSIAAFYSSPSYSPDTTSTTTTTTTTSSFITNNNVDDETMDLTSDFDDTCDMDIEMETEAQYDEHSEYYYNYQYSHHPSFSNVTSSSSSSSQRLSHGRRRVVVPAHRLAQSRLIGHRHRANEKIRTEQLDVEVAILSEQNLLLRKQLAAAAATHGITAVHLPGSGIDLRRDSRKILRVDNVSPKSVLALIELIALRRNLISNTQHSSILIECPPQSCIEKAIQAGDSSDLRMLKMHERWSEYEKYHSVSKFLLPIEEKRCTRCKKIRNGHARSICDDGFKVGSLIAYQGPQHIP